MRLLGRRSQGATDAWSMPARVSQAPAKAPLQAPQPATHAPPQEERGTDVRRRLLPPYNVILHNDDHNTIPYVVTALRKSVPGMSLSKATAIMWEAHTSGKAIVITCPLELAELYQQRLLSFGLTATIEKDQ
jgi:ATP-dependent Clp protease adaptor protein ClpS